MGERDRVPDPPTPEVAHERIVRELLKAAHRKPAIHDQFDYDLDLLELDRRYYEENGGTSYTRPVFTLHLGVFLDATWELCRLGIVRPGRRLSADEARGLRFTLTESGRQQLLDASAQGLVTVAGAAIVKELEQHTARFGEAFIERVKDAVTSHSAGAHLACCAMCGAAAETILLSLAIALGGDEDEVLKEYLSRSGRAALMKRIKARLSHSDSLQLETYAKPLDYWRDAASHGLPARVLSGTAFQNLQLVRHLAHFVAGRWPA